MSKPGGVQLFMGDTNHPSSDATLLRLITKTSKLAYLVDSAGVEYPLQGFPATFVKAKGNTALVTGLITVNFVGLGLANEPDTNYSILLSCAGDETIHWGSKATTGFTITSSDGGSTSLVDWAVLRTA